MKKAALVLGTITLCGGAIAFYELHKRSKKKALSKLECYTGVIDNTTTKEEYATRGNNIISIDYDISIEFESDMIAGQIDIEIKLAKNAKGIYFDFSGTSYSNLSINGELIDPCKAYSQNKIVIPDSLLKNGVNKFKMCFTSEYRNNGIEHITDKSIFMSHTTPTSMPCVIPCINQPDLMSTIKIKICENNQTFTYGYKNSSITTLPIFIGSYQIVSPLSQGGIPIKIYSSKEGIQSMNKTKLKMELFDTAIKGVEKCESIFQIKYPFDSLSIYIVQNSHQLSESYNGIVAIDESMFKSSSSQYSICMAILKELIHMFLPHVKWWDDLFIKEAVANVIASIVYCELNTLEINQAIIAWQLLVAVECLKHPNKDIFITQTTVSKAINSFSLNKVQNASLRIYDLINEKGMLRLVELINANNYDFLKEALKAHNCIYIKHEENRLTANKNKVEFSIVALDQMAIHQEKVTVESTLQLSNNYPMLLDVDHKNYCYTCISFADFQAFSNCYSMLYTHHKYALLKSIPMLERNSNKKQIVKYLLDQLEVENSTQIIKLNLCMLVHLMSYTLNFDKELDIAFAILLKKINEIENSECLYKYLIFCTKSQSTLGTLYKEVMNSKIKDTETLCSGLAKLMASSIITQEEKTALVQMYNDPAFALIFQSCSPKKHERDNAWNSFKSFQTTKSDMNSILMGMKQFWVQSENNSAFISSFFNNVMSVYDNNGDSYGDLYMKLLKPPRDPKVGNLHRI